LYLLQENNESPEFFKIFFGYTIRVKMHNIIPDLPYPFQTSDKNFSVDQYV